MTDNNKPFVCNYCNNSFSRQYTLKRHIETNQKCLQSRNTIMANDYKCDYCSYETSINHNYKRHISTCKNKLLQLAKTEENKLKLELEEKDKIIREKDLQLIIQQKELELRKEFDLKRISSSVVNNTINLQINYSQNTLSNFKEIEDNIQHLINNQYTSELFHRGIIGFISFLTKLLKQQDKAYYLCHSKSKKLFHRLIDGEVDVDHKANKLIDFVLPHICRKINFLYDDLERNHYEKRERMLRGYNKEILGIKRQIRELKRDKEHNENDKETAIAKLQNKRKELNDLIQETTNNLNREEQREKDLHNENDVELRKLINLESDDRAKVVKQLATILIAPKDLVRYDQSSRKQIVPELYDPDPDSDNEDREHKV